MEMENLDTVKLKLKHIIAVDLDSNISLEEIKDDISLYEDGVGLDSINIINLIVVIEKKFDINFGDEINAKAFGSINNLTTFIHEKLKSKASSLSS